MKIMRKKTDGSVLENTEKKAETRIIGLPPTVSTALDDSVAIDSPTLGTRSILVDDLVQSSSSLPTSDTIWIDPAGTYYDDDKEYETAYYSFVDKIINSYKSEYNKKIEKFNKVKKYYEDKIENKNKMILENKSYIQNQIDEVKKEIEKIKSDESADSNKKVDSNKKLASFQSSYNMMSQANSELNLLETKQFKEPIHYSKCRDYVNKKFFELTGKKRKNGLPEIGLQDPKKVQKKIDERKKKEILADGKVEDPWPDIQSAVSASSSGDTIAFLGNPVLSPLSTIDFDVNNSSIILGNGNGRILWAGAGPLFRSQNGSGLSEIMINVNLIYTAGDKILEIGDGEFTFKGTTIGYILGISSPIIGVQNGSTGHLNFSADLCIGTFGSDRFLFDPADRTDIVFTVQINRLQDFDAPVDVSGYPAEENPNVIQGTINGKKYGFEINPLKNICYTSIDAYADDFYNDGRLPSTPVSVQRAVDLLTVRNGSTSGFVIKTAEPGYSYVWDTLVNVQSSSGPIEFDFEGCIIIEMGNGLVSYSPTNSNYQSFKCSRINYTGVSSAGFLFQRNMVSEGSSSPTHLCCDYILTLNDNLGTVNKHIFETNTRTHWEVSYISNNSANPSALINDTTELDLKLLLDTGSIGSLVGTSIAEVRPAIISGSNTDRAQIKISNSEFSGYVILQDQPVLSWDWKTFPNALLIMTPLIGDTRTLPNAALSGYSPLDMGHGDVRTLEIIQTNSPPFQELVLDSIFQTENGTTFNTTKSASARDKIKFERSFFGNLCDASPKFNLS
jgi:hypothetical protein